MLAAPALGQSAASPFTNAQRFDAMGRVTGTISTDPDGAGPLPHRAVRNSYDAAGRLVTVETGTLSAWQSEAVAPAAWTGFTIHHVLTSTYDPSDRKLTERLSAAGAVHTLTQYSYDAAGRLECTAIRMNPAAFATPPASACTPGPPATPVSLGDDRITRNVYDAASQILQVQEAYDTAEQADVATRSYSPTGRVQTLTDAENNRTTYVYDGHDRLRETRYPLPTRGAGASNPADREELTYDANGNITSRRLRDGRTIGYAHDALNRLTAVDVPSGDYMDEDRAYSYDLLGRRLTATMGGWGGGGGSTWAWDALGRMTSDAGHFGARTMLYDLAGRMTRLTWTDGFFVQYDHLVTGEVSHVRERDAATGQPAASGPGVLATYAYDDLGRRISLTRGNGTSASYSYDDASRLGQLVEDMAGTGNDLTLGFAYNPAAQIRSNTRSNSNYSYTARVNGGATDTINGLNQMTATGGTTVSYGDSRGNITGIGSAEIYLYTSENRLAAANIGGAGLYLPYWANGDLAQIYTASTSTAVSFEHVDGRMIAERDGGWNVLRRYVHGPGVNEPLVWYEGSGTSDRRFLHADERGSIVAISNSAGAVTNVNAYDEYGVPAAGNVGRFQYTGQAWIPEIQLHYYRARFYNPRLGRFMQTDPIGTEGGINLYEYAGSDPVNRDDPSGNGPEIALCALAGPAAPGCVVGNLIISAAVIALGGASLIAGSSDDAIPGPHGDDSGKEPEDQSTQASQEEGSIYCLEGCATPSGERYIGRAADMDERARDSSDGRDRRNATVVGTYPRGDRQAGRNAEQREINRRGGVRALDNRRNEVAPRFWPGRGIAPPDRDPTR